MTATAILDNLKTANMQHHDALEPQQLGGRESVLSLTTVIQTILGDAIVLATIMFPHKSTLPGKAKTPPHHMWPKSVKHDVLAIRLRTKALRRLTIALALTPSTETLSPLNTGFTASPPQDEGQNSTHTPHIRLPADPKS
jgi:hypothetical protein